MLENFNAIGIIIYINVMLVIILNDVLMNY